MRVYGQFLAVLAAAAAASAASNVSIGPQTFSCNIRCMGDVAKVEKPECYSQIPDTVNAEDDDRDIVDVWCVCNAGELNGSIQPCIESECPAGSWDYYLDDCRLNYIGKPDPKTNDGNALGHMSAVATGAMVLALALFGSL
ncbi:hypothetical protein AURDEDRAFT_113346 [Auricularia subglabra TFB-10046 SS5]|nr:hypothetical protein AURDEDRAFT_113346 [Auricularia subglabra TFB-10046 SS5]